MSTETITINGTQAALAASGLMTWTASNISLRLRPDMTWRATRDDLDAIGATAQEAANNLLAAERKTEKAAKLAARSTKGQIFAREMRSYLRIGARTRRFDNSKWDKDGHRDILNLIAEANNFPGMRNADSEAIFRTAFAALCSWEKHIDGYRADAMLVSHINGMTPYQFCALLGDMIDAEITNVGQGELFFADMACDFCARAA